MTEVKTTNKFNWTVLFLVTVLAVMGLVNLFSALNMWGGSVKMSLFWSQVVWVTAGFAVMLGLAFFDYRLLEKAAPYLYGFSILLLILVLVFGKVIAGHKSWLSVGPVAVQPSEFAKFSLIIFLSKYFSENPRPEGAEIYDLWKPIIYSAIPAVLVAVQGDMGSAVFFVLIFGTYAWLGRLRGKWFTILISLAAVGAIVLYFFYFSSYQRARFSSFIDPSSDSKGSGYHIIQSQIAVGSGKLLGKGYLKGNINKLRFLPEKHTDFVFPVLAEEWGFVGCMITLAFYFALFASGIEIARKSRDRTGLFLAFGVVAFLFWQVVINLGGVLGLMPLTGVTLPFLSYGGSSTIVTMAGMGVLLGVSNRRFLF